MIDLLVCDKCKALIDCPFVEILQNGLGTPVAPDDCPKIIKDEYKRFINKA